MPIWIKAILFCWFGLTPVGVIYINLWADQHALAALNKEYPRHISAVGLLIVLDILMVIPFVFWFIFMR